MNFVEPPTCVPYCTHTSTTTELLPQTSRHYAKLKCVACGAVLKLLPRPENVTKWKLNGYRLAKLQMLPGLQPEEREFLQGLAKQASVQSACKFSPKQQEELDRICQTYLQEGGQA